MEVIIQIEGRDAIPVRAIPLLTYWQTMTPDALAQALAGDEHYFRFESMRAYRFDDGRVLPAGYWTNNVVRPLQASSDTIKAHEISHEAGLQEFRTESLQKLPAGVYVWRDEFTEAHQRHYSKTTLPLDFEDNDVPLTDVEIAQLTAEHQERITLDFSLFIDPSTHMLVMQGFGVPPTDTAPAQTSATPTPVVAASDGPAKPTATVDKGWVMKKAALIDKHADQWPTIRRDFQDASENGFSQAAKAPGHGEWFEAAALNWADQRGKRTKETQQGPANSVFNLTGTKHTMEG